MRRNLSPIFPFKRSGEINPNPINGIDCWTSASSVFPTFYITIYDWSSWPLAVNKIIILKRSWGRQRPVQALFVKECVILYDYMGDSPGDARIPISEP